MNTTLQELRLEIQNYCGDQIFKDVYMELFNKYFEKEKEQIIKAHIDGFDHIVVDFKKQEYAEQYYNQTYNQKQHIIDIMKADEDDGLYNQNKS